MTLIDVIAKFHGFHLRFYLHNCDNTGWISRKLLRKKFLWYDSYLKISTLSSVSCRKKITTIKIGYKKYRRYAKSIHKHCIFLSCASISNYNKRKSFENYLSENDKLEGKMKTGRCYLSYRFLCNVKRRNVYEEHEQLKDQTYNQKEIDFWNR